MMLCIYAIKCDISEEELEEDCLQLMEVFDQKSSSDENRFTEKDVADALQAFYDKTLVSYPVNSIQNRSGIEIPKNKRNGRKQEVHLARARAVQAIDYPDGEWRKGNGRPSAQVNVQRWRKENPTGTKAECNRATGMDPKTIRKWWDAPPKERISDPWSDNVIIGGGDDWKLP
jgi:hypothetical protein